MAPGATLALNFTDAANEPVYAEGGEYFAVSFHGVAHISVPLDVSRWPGAAVTVTIPQQFEERGIIIVGIANEVGAPNLSTVVVGPEILLQQPEQVGVA